LYCYVHILSSLMHCDPLQLLALLSHLIGVLCFLSLVFVSLSSRYVDSPLLFCRSRKLLILRNQPDGTVLVTDGPYTETKEHMGGFWILECADMDEALAWARKGAISCDAVGEVRELLFFPAPEQEPGGSK